MSRFGDGPSSHGFSDGGVGHLHRGIVPSPPAVVTPMGEIGEGSVSDRVTFRSATERIVPEVEIGFLPARGQLEETGRIGYVNLGRRLPRQGPGEEAVTPGARVRRFKPEAIARLRARLGLQALPTEAAVRDASIGDSGQGPITDSTHGTGGGELPTGEVTADGASPSGRRESRTGRRRAIRYVQGGNIPPSGPSLGTRGEVARASAEPPVGEPLGGQGEHSEPREIDQPQTKAGEGGDGGKNPPLAPSVAGGDEGPSKGEIDATFTEFMAEEIAEKAEEVDAERRFRELSPEQQQIAIAAIAAQTRVVEYDPNENRPFKDKLAGVYTNGDPLVRSLSDITEPVFDDQPEGAQAYTLEFSQEAIKETGLGEHILGVSAISIDAHEENGRQEPDSLSFRIKSQHREGNIAPFRIEAEGKDEDIVPGFEEVHVGKMDAYPTGEEGTVIVTRVVTIYEPSSRPPEIASIFENFSTWPMKASSTFEDMLGRDVFPPNVLHAGRHYGGVDMNGCDVLLRLLEAESRIRQK